LTKYNHMLDDADVKRWYDNLAASSQITAEVYLRSLGLYCELNRTNPKEILLKAGSKSFRDSFIDFVRRLEREGRAGSYIERFKKVLMSWLLYNGVNVKLKVNIRSSSDTPTITDERVPTRDELAGIIRRASARGRVAVAMMAFSGLRPESLGDYLGRDGIRLGDFPEAKITKEGVEFEKLPARVLIRRNLSKGRFQYFTFIPEEAATYIREYLQERVKQNEQLSPESPLLQFDPRGKKKNAFLRTTLVTRDIREAIRAAGFKWRPYILRAYCDTAFDIAESKGLISHPWRVFFMGHKGDIEARYSTNKGRLPHEMVEQMRDAYKRCQRFLQTIGAEEEESKEKIMRAFKEQFLLLAGLKKEEIQKINLDELSNEELQSIVRQRLLGEMAINGSRQKVVPLQEVKSWIRQGYEYVASLPSGEAIVKVPF